MPEWVSEHIVEIALLIYILYPLLKRWRDRQRRKREQAGKSPETSTEAPARESRPSAPSPQPAREPQRQPQPPPPPQVEPAVAKRPTEADFLATARARLDRLKQQTSRLLTRAGHGLRRYSRHCWFFSYADVSPTPERPDDPELSGCHCNVKYI